MRGYFMDNICTRKGLKILSEKDETRQKALDYKKSARLILFNYLFRTIKISNNNEDGE